MGQKCLKCLLKPISLLKAQLTVLTYLTSAHNPFPHAKFRVCKQAIPVSILAHILDANKYVPRPLRKRAFK